MLLLVVNFYETMSIYFRSKHQIAAAESNVTADCCQDSETAILTDARILFRHDRRFILDGRMCAHFGQMPCRSGGAI